MSDEPVSMMPDRRLGERRRSERRSDFLAESWFDVVGGEPGETRPPPSSGDAGAGPDSRFLSRQARRIVSAGQTTFERIYAAFINARVVVGVALVLTQLVALVFGAHSAPEIGAVIAVYAGLSIVAWLWPRLRKVSAPASKVAYLPRVQWAATIGVDIVCFSALFVLAPQGNLSFVALLVLPVLMAGVLTPRIMALATAAAVSLIVIVHAWLDVASGAEAAQWLTQAGLTGAGFFVISLLAGELAGRLAREELTARGSLEIARQQAQLNRLVIEEMQDGVIVVDRRGRVRTANPAARAMLAPQGLCQPAPFHLQGAPAWGELVRAVDRAFAETTWPEAGRDVLLEFESGVKRTLRLRVRFARRRESKEGEDLCVLFFEDVRTVQARTRQEKLAAMGRVSAGIAHEIRNPLAAISQANALLAEDAVDPGQKRLTQMVRDNVERLTRIVNDVLEVGAAGFDDAAVIDAAACVGAFCSEWSRTEQLRLGDQSPLWVDLPVEPLGVVFDADHLRRVLVNLLDNARRHASGQPGSVRVRVSARNEGQATLSVTSDGAPIEPEVERYLFEPFFSTRSRGTGLGLYICRELCERYGASIDYRLRAPSDPNRNEFFVAMRRGKLLTTEASLHLTT